MESIKDSDISIYFADDVLSRSSGSFDKVSSIMMKDIHQSTDGEWMLSSYVEMTHRFGSCVFELHFYKNKSVCIYNYRIKRPNASNLSDIQFLKQALSGLGWNRLYPYHSEVDRNTEFWKSLWDTGIIEYSKFDSMYSRQ